MNIKRKSVKVVVIVASALAILFIGGWIGTSVFINRKVKQLLTEQLPVGSAQSSFSTSFGRIRVNSLNRTVSVDNLKINMGSKSQGNDPTESLELSVKRVTLGGVAYKRRAKSLKIRSIDIDTPRITYSGIPYATRIERADSLSKKSIGETINSLDLRHVDINNADISIAYWDRQGRRGKFSAENLTVSANMLAIDSLERIAPEDFAGAAVKLDANRLSYLYNEGSMLLDVKGITVNSESGSMAADSINILPQYPKYAFAQRMTNHSDWTRIKIADVVVAGINVEELMRHRTVSIDTMSIGGGSLESLKDRNVNAPARIKKLAHESIQSIPWPTTITTLTVADFDFTYDEIALGKEAPGTIVISGLNADFEGFTNVAADKNQYITMRATAGFYHSGEGAFSTTLKIPIHKDNDRFTMDGHIGAINAAHFNWILENLMNARIESGHIKSIDFDITGDSKSSSVNMTFLYDDLAIALLEKNDHSKERIMLSSIINAGLIYSSNPMKNREIRKGVGVAERDPYRSQFNYLYRILMSGIKDTAIRNVSDILKE